MSEERECAFCEEPFQLNEGGDAPFEIEGQDKDGVAIITVQMCGDCGFRWFERFVMARVGEGEEE